MVSRFLEESRAFLKMPCSPGNKVTCLEKIKQLVISIPLAAWYSDISVVKEGQMMELSLSLKVLIETGGEKVQYKLRSENWKQCLSVQNK